MSTSTSPRFKSRVALLWGDRWWIEGRTEPIAFGELSRAAGTLLAEFGDARPTRLRLIYQPATLAAASVACPNGNRATLRAALGEEFPALASEDCAWGFEPIAGGHERFATVLYCETASGLYSLVAALRAGGIEVEGVWPLPTLLNHVPEDWPDHGALTVLAVADGQTLVYRHTPEGTREVQTAVGSEAEAIAGAAIPKTLARSNIALYVAALDDVGQRLAVRFGPSDANLRPVLWSRLVIVARSLSVRQPTQLLPAPAFFHPDRLMTAATVAALLAVAGLSAVTAREAWLRRIASVEHEQARRTLRNEVARLQANEREIAQLRAELAALAPNRTACGELLRALGRGLPPQVVLTRIHADRDGFVMSGGVAGAGLTAGAWRDWLATSIADNVHLRLAESPATPAADFTVKGFWR